jgi:hypothetical protein
MSILYVALKQVRTKIPNSLQLRSLLLLELGSKLSHWECGLRLPLHNERDTGRATQTTTNISYHCEVVFLLIKHSLG